MRKVTRGAPADVFKLDCAPCEQALRSDPLWTPTLSELPETHDEKLAREDFDKRGAFDRDAVMAMAMAKLAGVELPETLRRPLTGLAPHVPVVPGLMECDAGHPNEPGMKFCGECGLPLRAPGKRTCPDGHEVAASVKFCGECGKGVPSPVTAVPAIEGTPRAPVRAAKPLKDRRLDELQVMAREANLDAGGTRRQLLERLKAAA